jgi:hypothetical protein
LVASVGDGYCGAWADTILRLLGIVFRRLVATIFGGARLQTKFVWLKPCNLLQRILLFFPPRADPFDEHCQDAEGLGVTSPALR